VNDRASKGWFKPHIDAEECESFEGKDAYQIRCNFNDHAKQIFLFVQERRTDSLKHSGGNRNTSLTPTLSGLFNRSARTAFARRASVDAACEQSTASPPANDRMMNLAPALEGIAHQFPDIAFAPIFGS